MTVYDRIDLAVGRVSGALAIIGALAGGVIMVTMTADVIERTTAGKSLAGAYEFVEMMLVVAVFLSLPYGERNRAHVRVELVTGALRPRAARWVRLFGHVVASIIAIWIAYAVFGNAWDSFQIREYTTGLIDFPLYPSRACVFVGMAWLALELVMTTLGIVRDVPHDDAESEARTEALA